MSTAPAEVGINRLRRARWGRRAFFVALAGFLAAGALGFLGVRTTSVEAVGGGYELRVHYATISRGGLATPWSVEIRRPGGFDGGTVTLATTESYFEVFDENGLDPDPVEAVTDGERVLWTFRTPTGGDTITVSFDGRIEPAVQLERAAATTSVLGPDGSPAASVRYRTFVLP